MIVSSFFYAFGKTGLAGKFSASARGWLQLRAVCARLCQPQQHEERGQPGEGCADIIPL